MMNFKIKQSLHDIIYVFSECTANICFCFWHTYNYKGDRTKNEQCISNYDPLPGVEVCIIVSENHCGSH